MTSNTIAYLRLQEERRTNQENEAIRREANAVSASNAYLNYAASIYNTDKTVAASRFKTRTEAGTARSNAILNSNTQRYVSDNSYRASTYQTDITHLDRLKEIDTNRMKAETERAKQKEEERHNKQMETINYIKVIPDALNSLFDFGTKLGKGFN